MSDTTPKKKRGRPSKASSSQKQIPKKISDWASNDIEMSSEEVENNEDIFNMAILEYVADLEEKIYTNKRKDAEHLRKILEEYMSSFMIIGYDLQGNMIEIVSEKSDRDMDALNELLKKTFIQSQIKQQMGF